MREGGVGAGGGDVVVRELRTRQSARPHEQGESSSLTPAKFSFPLLYFVSSFAASHSVTFFPRVICSSSQAAQRTQDAPSRR